MNGSGASGLIGKWNLVSTGGSTNSSSEFDLFGTKVRIDANFTTASANPKGYYNITSSEFKAVGISYDMSGSLSIKEFENDVLQSEATNPLPPTPIGPYDQSTQYKISGTDSISFTGSTPAFVFQTASGSFVPPSGCKFKLEGNKLTLLFKYNFTSTDNSSGFPITDKSTVDMNVVLQKQ